MNDKTLGNIDRTRSAAQRAAYETTIGKGVCPFCGPTENMPIEIRERMIIVGTHWRAWKNPFQYPGHAMQLVVAPIEHWTRLDQVTPEAWMEYGEIITRLTTMFDMPGGGIVTRFGKDEYKGGSIAHLHTNIQVPDLTTFSIAVFYKDAALATLLDSPKEDLSESAPAEG